MPTPIHAPRINNNDDIVRLSAILAGIGSALRAGDPIADVETDKATFTVESPEAGYLLAVNGKLGDSLAVGSVLAWIGASPEEAAPGVAGPAAGSPGDAPASEPTLKALLLLKQYGLTAAEVSRSGSRLTAEDVERHAERHGAGHAGAIPAKEWAAPAVAGRVARFTSEERAMQRTVAWHRDQAVAGYVEIAYDPAAWDRYAGEFQERHGLLLNPLLPLMCRRLAALAVEMPRLNATVSPEGAYLYGQVNLGFTVQTGAQLYLVVTQDAAGKSELEFVSEAGELQRAAMKRALKPHQTAGATISFSSMARWKVSRHIPILPPQTGMIVAHASAGAGAACLGATYDHRLLTGFDAVQALQALSSPGR
jgi:pyruvate/2-oxoglutarate dehydrogenase complex dihydrolipoamide acyltransferase (E2) component